MLAGSDLLFGLWLSFFREHVAAVVGQKAARRGPSATIKTCSAESVMGGISQLVLGERGQALSGGERQRLALARAMLKQAPILILDEAASALDTETEARIKRALDSLRKDRTTFVIAQRLSTVLEADQILVMEHGRIVEAGGFAELIRAKGASRVRKKREDDGSGIKCRA